MLDKPVTIASLQAHGVSQLVARDLRFKVDRAVSELTRAYKP